MLQCAGFPMKVILQADREDHLSVLPLQTEPFLICPLADPGWVTHPSATLLFLPPRPLEIKTVRPNFVLRRPRQRSVSPRPKTEHWEGLDSPIYRLPETHKPEVNFGSPCPGGRSQHPVEHSPIQTWDIAGFAGVGECQPGKGCPPPTPRPCPARARRRPRAGQGKPLSAVLIPARLRAAAPSAPRGAPGPPLTPGPAHVLGVSGRARGQLRGGLIAAAKWTGEEVGFKGGKGSSRSHASPAVLARLGTGERAELSLTIWVQTGPFHEGWVHASPLPGHRHGTNNEWHKVSYSSCMWTRRWKPWGSRCMFKALVANTGRAGTSASYGCLYALVSESHLYMFVQH